MACHQHVAEEGKTASTVDGGGATEATAESLEALIGTSPTIGLQIQPSSDNEAFASIVDAQLSADGRFVAVLDLVPPYVRVFDSNGTLQAAFVTKGDGPGEARNPIALTISKDRLLVVQPGRMSWFTLSGDLVAERSNLPFWPQSAAPGCDDDFLLYGPGRDTDGTLVSLRSVRSATDTSISLIHDTGTPELFTRHVRPLAQGRGVVAVHHDGRNPPETLTLACPDYRVVRTDTFPELARRAVSTNRSRSVGVVQLRNDQPIFNGIVVIDRYPLLSVSTGGRTRLIDVSENAIHSYYMRNSMRLLDAQSESIVLLARPNPVPHLVLVRYDRFVEAIR